MPAKLELTVQGVFQRIRAMGLQVRREDGEWRIRIPGRPDADYFTTINEDAVQTATLMRDARRPLEVGVVNYGANRFEVQRNGRKHKVVDTIKEAVAELAELGA